MSVTEPIEKSDLSTKAKLESKLLFIMKYLKKKNLTFLKRKVLEKMSNYEAEENEDQMAPETELPVPEKAIAWRDERRISFKNEDGTDMNNCCSADVGAFGSSGVGLELYFRFVIFLANIFMMLTAIHVIV